MKNWIASSLPLLAMTASGAATPAMTPKRSTHAQENTDSAISDGYINLARHVRAFGVGENLRT